MQFYINFERGVVKSSEGCGAGSEPVTNKTLWTFEALDETPPIITFLVNPQVTSLCHGKVANENVMWKCSLVVNSIASLVNCSEVYMKQLHHICKTLCCMIFVHLMLVGGMKVLQKLSAHLENVSALDLDMVINALYLFMSQINNFIYMKPSNIQSH